MTTLLDDLRAALRALRRSPGHVTVMILSLAPGLGGAMAAFAIVDAVRLRALPFPDGERMVVLSEVPATRDSRPATEPECSARCDVSYTTFADVLRRYPFRTLEGVIGFTSGGKVYMSGGEPLPVSGGILTPEAFALLRVSPVLGRPLLASDDQLGVPLVTLLSHDFWTNLLAADPGVIGRVIKLSDSQYIVVGIMPPGFDFESGSDFWLPPVPTLDPSTRPSIRSLTVIARIRPGHTIADARAELATVKLPDGRTAAGPTPMTVAAAPLRDRYVAATQSYDVMFGAMVGCLLALAIANLANLSLVRALDQRRDATIRAALGASRPRLARQLALQHLLLVVPGTLAGVLVARWLLDVLRSVAILNAQRLTGMEATVDARVVAFAVTLSLLVGAVLAIAPVRVALRAAGDSALRDSAGSTAPRSRWQQAMVVVQVAGAFALLVCGALLRRSATELARVEPGFDLAHTLQASPSFPHPWRVPGTYIPVTERMLSALQGVPGVRAAAARTTIARRGASFTVDGGTAPLDGSVAPSTEHGVSDDYFTTLGIPLVRGRAFAPADVAGGAPVAIVNRWAADRWWPGQDPVGKAVRVDTAPGAGQLLTIVGVAADNKAARGNLLFAGDGPELYRPWRQASTAFPVFFASTAGNPTALLKPVRELMVREVPDRPLGASAMSEGVAQQLSGVRTNATQAGWISLVGLLIAWLGIHGVVGYGVRRRAREIGIRGAMGATPVDITRLVFTDLARVCLAGVALGIPLAFGGAALVESLLFHVRGSDPAILLVVAGALLVASALAAALPTWRAVRIDVVNTVRSEGVS